MIIILSLAACCLAGAVGVVVGYIWGTENTMNDTVQLQAKAAVVHPREEE